MIMGAIPNDGDGRDTEEHVRVLLFELDALKQENINLKNGLSRALQNRVANGFVDRAEEFQQLFINKDQVIDLIRHEVSALMIAGPHDSANGQQAEKFVQMQQEIEVLVSCFVEMKAAFEKYLSEM
jgi:hypothetical protein